MIRWRCTKSRTTKCPCILKTHLNINNLILISIEHKANENIVSAVKIKNITKERAKLIDVVPA